MPRRTSSLPNAAASQTRSSRPRRGSWSSTVGSPRRAGVFAAVMRPKAEADQIGEQNGWRKFEILIDRTPTK